MVIWIGVRFTGHRVIRLLVINCDMYNRVVYPVILNSVDNVSFE